MGMSLDSRGGFRAPEPGLGLPESPGGSSGEAPGEAHRAQGQASDLCKAPAEGFPGLPEPAWEAPGIPGEAPSAHFIVGEASVFRSGVISLVRLKTFSFSIVATPGSPLSFARASERSSRRREGGDRRARQCREVACAFAFTHARAEPSALPDSQGEGKESPRFFGVSS